MVELRIGQELVLRRPGMPAATVTATGVGIGWVRVAFQAPNGLELVVSPEVVYPAPPSAVFTLVSP